MDEYCCSNVNLNEQTHVIRERLSVGSGSIYCILKGRRSLV